MIHPLSDIVRCDPMDVLWHYVHGEVPDWANGSDGPVVWKRYSHRGIQRLDRIRIPRKQRRYIHRPRFQVGHNQAFERVVRACADPSREGKTWITEELVRAFIDLHERGFAYSAEAWEGGALAGGIFGLHVGGYVSVESMFHRVSNASKAAYGQTLLHLRERGFEAVDVGFVASHLVNYGEEWVPQWRFEQMLRSLLPRPVSFADGRPAPLLPWPVRLGLPIVRRAESLVRRLRRAAAVCSAIGLTAASHAIELLTPMGEPIVALA